MSFYLFSEIKKNTCYFSLPIKTWLYWFKSKKETIFLYNVSVYMPSFSFSKKSILFTKILKVLKENTIYKRKKKICVINEIHVINKYFLINIFYCQLLHSGLLYQIYIYIYILIGGCNFIFVGRYVKLLLELYYFFSNVFILLNIF